MKGCAVTVLSILVGACNGGGTPAQVRGPAPEFVGVASANMTLGYALAPLRAKADVDGFRITKSLVTVGDYHHCVGAGACQPPAMQAGSCTGSTKTFTPDGYTYLDNSSTDDLPVTCVTPDQAVAYCSWVGGRLPRLAEWMLAARGADVHRYSWGDDTPDCKRLQRISFFASVDGACCGVDCGAMDVLRVRRHPSGASPSGLLDVMLTRSELVGPDAEAAGNGCPAGATACLVWSLGAGGIDGLMPVPGAGAGQPVAGSYGFRCAWNGASQ